MYPRSVGMTGKRVASEGMGRWYQQTARYPEGDRARHELGARSIRMICFLAGRRLRAVITVLLRCDFSRATICLFRPCMHLIIFYHRDGNGMGIARGLMGWNMMRTSTLE